MTRLGQVALADFRYSLNCAGDWATEAEFSSSGKRIVETEGVHMLHIYEGG